MLKAKDLMTDNVVSVQKETPIYDALELLLENNITGIPVVRGDMTLIGVLSEKDALTLFNADEEGKNKTVSDFMTQPAIHFDEDEGLQEVCDCLTNNYFRRIPVTSEGKLIGIITRSDIIKYILQEKVKSRVVD